jgi:hypothetical protein
MTSDELEDWNNGVLESEKLSEWSWSIVDYAGSECIHELKEIRLYHHKEKHLVYEAKLSFLHEVAHAIVNEPIGDFHNKDFFSEYARLISDYLGIDKEGE